MLVAYLSMLGLLIVLGGLVHRHPELGHRPVLRRAGRQLGPLLVRLPVALLAASFLAELIPQSLFGDWLGDAAGFQGILIASLIGGLLPGGPMVTFPLILVVARAGAGTPQLIALLTAWACIALHRVLSYELPTLGWPFVWRRLLVSSLLAPLAGLLAVWAIDLGQMFGR